MKGMTYQASLLFTIFVEVTEEGNLIGRCHEIPMAVGKGKTLQELRRNMADAISLTRVSPHELSRTYPSSYIAQTPIKSFILKSGDT
jgi:predicted RNase H-like HicB family nuclease